MVDTYDLIVVGTGWYGLAAAKAYIEEHPGEEVLIIEAEGSCGGTWSHDRLYPGLKSNNIWGSYEYPDFPMDGEVYGLKEGQHIPSATLHRYLTDYAKKFGVFARTRFNTKVTAVEALESGSWKITAKPTNAPESPEAVLTTKKLIMATGLTSEPNLPTYPGQDTFTPRFFHSRDFCTYGDAINSCKRAVVVGGGKSALDCAYAFATAGANEDGVDLVIRNTGNGPIWMSPPYVTPLKRKLEELIATRLLTWFSPCIWGAEDGYGGIRRFLHGTTIGNMLVRGFWFVLGMDMIQANGYDAHPEVHKLKPWQSPMWTGSALGILNFDTDIFDLVKKGKIRVHQADIAKLEGKSVTLTSGESFKTDVLLCATGWKKESALKFVNFDTSIGKGFSEERRRQLIGEADEQVLKLFPMLKTQPELRPEQQKSRSKEGTEPLRNYRFIVPPQAVKNRNIAFAGAVSSVCTSPTAHVQGLWISAFLDGKLKRAPLPSGDDDAKDGGNNGAVKEAVLHTQFEKWRTPCGYGSGFPDFAFDSIPYVDLLMNDLGLKVHRKGSAMAELLQGYKPKDYAGVMDEWRDLQVKQ